MLLNDTSRKVLTTLLASRSAHPLPWVPIMDVKTREVCTIFCASCTSCPYYACNPVCDYPMPALQPAFPAGLSLLDMEGDDLAHAQTEVAAETIFVSVTPML